MLEISQAIVSSVSAADLSLTDEVREGVRIAFPSSGWTSIADARSPSDFHLKLSMDGIVDYFVVRRAGDGLPRQDFRNLGDEAFALYKRGYCRDGELAKSGDFLLFRCRFKATMKTNTR